MTKIKKTYKKIDDAIMRSILIGVVIMALSSYCVIDSFIVPMTLQTCAVQLIAFLFPPHLAFLSVGVWIILGMLGLPIFAMGESGFGHVFGVRGGYLWGFLCAAPTISFFYLHFFRQNRYPWIGFTLSSLIGHGIILFFGGMFVFCALDMAKAWQFAIKPFLETSFLKTVGFSLFLHYLSILSKNFLKNSD